MVHGGRGVELHGSELDSGSWGAGGVVHGSELDSGSWGAWGGGCMAVS